MKAINFPAYPAVSGHSLNRGGSAMEIKHTHPQYTTEAQRLDKLKETRVVCLAAVAQVRGKSAKPRTLRIA